MTEYCLIHTHRISANTLYRIKQGKNISTKTIDMLCDILDCGVSEILRYDPTDERQEPG